MRLREELETKFKLLMIEKEKEHLAVVQKKTNEITSTLYKERQEWLEVKLQHEKENQELRKQLHEISATTIHEPSERESAISMRTIMVPPINLAESNQSMVKAYVMHLFM